MIFPLRFSERRLILIILDLFALNGGLLVSISLLPENQLTWKPFYQYPLWFLLISVLWLIIGFAFDVYDHRVAAQFSTTWRGIIKAGLVTGSIYLIILFISATLPGSRLALFSFFINFGFLLIGRAIYFLIFGKPIFNNRALIIGTGLPAQLIAQNLVESANGIYQILGFLSANDEEKKNLGGSNNPVSGELSAKLDIPILGNRKSLLNLIKRNQVNTLILAHEGKVDSTLLQTITDSLELGVEIVPMPVIYEQLTGRVPIDHIGEDWQVAMPINHPLTRPFNRFVKRASDVILASLGCLCLAPFFPFIALAIYLESPGPIFYSQERVGMGGRPFRAYKFRSMIPNAERDRPVWAGKNDPRVTRVGRLLRKTHLDEFPQFLNILKGEMSAVGPRPERPEFVEELAREIPFYRVRHAVKPGMAGWGLVRQGYGASKEDAFVKLQYDLYYIKHQSLWFDLVILLKTIFDTLTFRGRA